jgi:hypothetical protein
MRHVDAPPTWEAAARIYVAALQSGPSDGADAAREEILRLARQYEDACREIAGLRSVLEEIEKLADEWTQVGRLARAARI